MAVVEKESGILTENHVLTRTRAQDLDSVKKLNCWASGITDVSVIRKMTNLEVCSLSGNKISTLEDFSHCPNLQELYIRKNNIKSLQDIHWLKKLEKLRVLWLSDNDCSTGENYRMTVLKTLPNLQKLDNVVVTDEETNRALEEGEELPFPENFIPSVTSDVECLPEELEICVELEVTQEPNLDSVSSLLQSKFDESKKPSSKPVISKKPNLDFLKKKINLSDMPSTESNIETDPSRGDFEQGAETAMNQESTNQVCSPENMSTSPTSVISEPTIQSHTQNSSPENQNSETTDYETCATNQESADDLDLPAPQSQESAQSFLHVEKSSEPVLSDCTSKTDPNEESALPNPDKPQEPPEKPSVKLPVIKKSSDINLNYKVSKPPVSLTLEQSNKLREELGLKPLPVESLSATKSINSGITKAKNTNILQATLLLVKDLDKDSLEILRDVIQTRLDTL